MSQCPDCFQPFSHESGHECPGPSAVFVLFRRATRKRKNNPWVPHKTLSKRPSRTKEALEVQRQIAASKFPQFDFRWKVFVAQ